jgi:hypothetical protein
MEDARLGNWEQLFTEQVGMCISGMVGLHMACSWVESKWKNRPSLQPHVIVSFNRLSPLIAMTQSCGCSAARAKEEGLSGAGGEHTNSWGGD